MSNPVEQRRVCQRPEALAEEAAIFLFKGELNKGLDQDLDRKIGILEESASSCMHSRLQQREDGD